MTTCSALTVISLELPYCSLMVTFPPPGRSIIWFGCPVTTMGWPLLITSLAISELPDTDDEPFAHIAVALAIRKSAPMVLPNTVKSRLATDASARLWFPCPTVDAWNTSAVRSPGTVWENSDASLLPPSAGSGPVSESVTGWSPTTAAFTTNA